MLDYTEFYNSALDHIDLMQDYYNWQSTHNNKQFAYCQYPFILSIVAKRVILTKIATKQKDLKKKLKVSFISEPGLDMGGLTKEWFLLLIRQIFHPDYGMFVYHPRSNCYWFSVAQIENLQEYNLIGVLMGLAVYNSIILDLHFPTICYKKLLSPPIVPINVSSVGIIRRPTIEDLAQIMPDISKSLTELLIYEGNVEDDLCQTFQVSFEEFGRVETFPLKESGESIAVTNENREEYVQLYLDWVLNKAIFEQYRAFYLGFHSVCASNALLLLRPEEVETLVCGSPTINITELKKITSYEGFKPNDPIIKDFWKILDSLSTELKKKFLLFTTGSNRIPVGGMEEMTFKITKMINKRENLPEAHTCFNQLVLPEYETTDELKQKLIISISNAEGFGLE
ncbi:unnamed protein product [Bemisia tabaci]|uniref:HECT-type E3 ubiquitin transferase n=1 Tax=Bemisia tabaci TaxID=7038 RepID=A0A9P0AFM3_BEMTA|nr:unnamed protein product [Bemisia tabaci]